MARAAAASSLEAAAREYYNGYESYLFFKDLDNNFEEKKEEIRASLSAIAKKYIVRERLTVAITSDGAKGLEKELIASIGNGEGVAPERRISTLPVTKEGIAVPCDIGFAAMAYNMYEVGSAPNGSFDVARVLVGYEYLWTRIRVKGGAYGAGMSAGISGTLGFYSYRDPNPAASIEAIRGVADFLREFAASGADITKYIIGALGDVSAIKTPRMRGSGATQRYLRGITYEDDCALRESMLSTDAAELVRIAGVIEACVDSAAICLVGARNLLDMAKPDRILTL
jgi:Zn-dependent M16 (insulinase) family peptidase